MSLATGKKFDLSQNNSNVVDLVNRYSCVVQEYFQKRVELWLEMVGKKIFGIEHYWLRYEFADARGQIHCHLLATSNDKHMQHKVHKLKNDPKAQAKAVADWASKKFGLTAGFDPALVERLELDPLKVYNGDVEDKEADTEKLKNLTEMHNCSGYCLRVSTKADKIAFAELHGMKE